jgi:hypothetical protein
VPTHDEQSNTLFTDVLTPTPSGIRKTLALWDGLSIESQLELLRSIRQLTLPKYLRRLVAAKAFSSANPYLRYLAYKDDYFDRDSPEDMALRRAIREDPNELVRSVVKETDYVLFDPEFEIERFWKLAHSDRLAKVRQLSGSGEDLAKIIRHGVIPENSIPMLEVWEVLADYVGNPKFKERYSPEALNDIHDGMSAYSDSKQVETLWLLIPDVPQQIADLLVSTLPIEGGMVRGIPPEVESRLTDSLLSTLLWRKEVELKEKRKNIFLEFKRSDRLVQAALSAHFALSNEQFQAVEDAHRSGNSVPVEQLCFSARTLTVAQYDYLEVVASELNKYSWLESIDSHRRSLEPVPDHQVKEAITDARLLGLARKLSKGEALPNELSVLLPVRSDMGIWATFIELKANLEAQKKKESLIASLPYVDGEWRITPYKDDAGYVERKETSTPTENPPHGMDRVNVSLEPSHDFSGEIKQLRGLLIAVLVLTVLLAMKILL